METIETSLIEEINDKKELHLILSKTIGSLLALGTRRNELDNKLLNKLIEISSNTLNEADLLTKRLELRILFKPVIN